MVHILVWSPLSLLMVKPMSRHRFENLDPEHQKRLFENAAEEFGAMAPAAFYVSIMPCSNPTFYSSRIVAIEVG
jgi:hypothetical protein